MMDKINIVLAPIPGTPNYSFVEIEDESGKGLSRGNWVHLKDDLCAIQMPDPHLVMEWISVDDRLPEDYTWVLCYGDSAISTCGYSKREGFNHWDLKRAPGLNTDDITHWMPLPKPPMKQNK
jgi:hypothetical protein